MRISIEFSSKIDHWADSTAPKALADVFEALVGAMFLDSGYSLPIVWKFIESLLGDYISMFCILTMTLDWIDSLLEQSVRDPNINPIRSFYEQKGEFIE